MITILMIMAYRPLPDEHPDFDVLQHIVEAIFIATDGRARLEAEVPQIIRTAIDEVIDAPRTQRFLLEQTEQTEKTYLGTKVEILLRNYLRFPKGNVLDMAVDGVEVDIKNTMGSNWSIPQENLDRVAMLVRSNERRARCDVGLLLVRDAYLRPGRNRDTKRGLAAASFSDVWWLLWDHPYPVNFWQLLSAADRQVLMDAGGGKLRLAALFEMIQERPISRLQVQALAHQHDYMKRIRRNGGARDVLAPKGIALLWGQGDKRLIEALNLGPVGPDEFISYAPRTSDEVDLLRTAGHID